MTPNHAEQIDINEPWQMGYWSGRFGISRAQLDEAIKEVGCRVFDLRRYFRELDQLTPRRLFAEHTLALAG